MEMVNTVSYLPSDVQVALHVISSLDFLQPNSACAFLCMFVLHTRLSACKTLHFFYFDFHLSSHTERKVPLQFTIT
jgi:hypothetical protein